ncbi:cyclodeaminase [Anaerobacillus sp. MEB173]|uniref:cyclodeaminase n=1 Tax=Anaerobacillus sp. MEB173 TaxID=3383345 RepID=UPI003F932DAD
MKIFTEEEIRQHVQINVSAIDVVEDGFNSLAEGKVSMPPIMRVDIPENNGEVDVKTAYIKGKEMFAIKISTGFFNNYQLGLPSGNGMMILINTTTGKPEAVLLDNGYLTDVRTAAAGAIAAKHLAKKNVHTVGVIGSGSQARYQLQALKEVRDYKQVLVYARSKERVQKFIEETKAALGVNVIAAETTEELVKQSDVVITTTPSETPIIQAEWLHPGLHITAMGSDAEHKQELAADVLAGADRLVCDVKSQCFRLGELHHGLKAGVITENSLITELGEITSGKVVGRENDEQITVCDLTGTGVQDTAIALYAFQAMLAKK